MADLFDANANPDDLEKRMQSNGRIPEGLYKATLIGAKPHTSKQKGTESDELTFRIDGGPFDGKTVTDQLWHTEGMKDKRTLYAARLGLIQRTKDGKKFEIVEGKRDFMDCLDAPVVIDVVHEKYKREDGAEGVSTKLSFSGLKDPKDAKVIEALKKQGQGATAAASSAAASSAAEAAKNPSANGTAKKKPDLRNL